MANFNEERILSYRVGQHYGKGHEDGKDDEDDSENLLDELTTLNGSQAPLLKQAATIFLMMVVMMMMFLCHNYFKML